MTHYQAALALSCLLLLQNVALAGDCTGFQRINPFCKPGEDIKKGADKLGDSMVIASDNLYGAVNFWAQLIQWYHSGDREERKKAEAILQGVFGIKPGEAGQELKFEARLSFSGVDTTIHPLEVAIMTFGGTL